MKGSALEIALAVATAVIGVVFLGVGCAGYLFRPLGLGRRGWASVVGLLLIPPPLHGVWLLANLAGLALGLSLILLEWSTASRPMGQPLPSAYRDP